jgi:ABC-2 type transport system ATP-binding protein
MNASDARQRANELMASLDLAGLGARRVSTLSGGQRRRLDLALGLMHRPRLLFLDEPSTGMDPQNRANLWEHITRLRAEQGSTIVLTTHYLEEADAHAERVLVIDHGEVIADDTAAALKARLAGDRISLTVGAADAETGRAVIAELAREVSAAPASGGEVGFVARVDQGDRALPLLLRRLDAAGVAVSAATVSLPTLDDVFLNLTGRSLREDLEAAA